MASARIFICHDLSSTDGALEATRILTQLRQKLSAAGSDVVMYAGPPNEKDFFPFLQENLPTCQWFLLFQTPHMLQKSEVQEAVNYVRRLTSERRHQGLLRFIAYVAPTVDQPAGWEDIPTFGGTPDYPRAMEKMLLLLQQADLNPDATLINPPSLRAAPPPLSGNSTSTATMSSKDSVNTFLALPPTPERGVTPRQQTFSKQIKAQDNYPPFFTDRPERRINRTRRRGLYIGLIVGGIVLLVLLIIGGNDLLIYRALAPSKTSTPVPASRPPQTLLGSYINQGQLSINDTLTQPALWTDTKDNHGQCAFQNQAYHILVTAHNYNYGCLKTTGFTNLVMQAQLTITRGNCGGFGIRMGNLWPYQFYFCADGTYMFLRYDLGKPWIQHIMASGRAAGLKAGFNVSNTIALVAKGKTFIGFANGQQVASVTDPTYPDGGGIALMARNLTSTSDIGFTNLKVWRL